MLLPAADCAMPLRRFHIAADFPFFRRFSRYASASPRRHAALRHYALMLVPLAMPLMR